MLRIRCRPTYRASNLRLQLLIINLLWVIAWHIWVTFHELEWGFLLNRQNWNFLMLQSKLANIWLFKVVCSRYLTQQIFINWPVYLIGNRIMHWRGQWWLLNLALSEKLPLWLHFSSVNVSSECEFAVWAGEEYWILEAKWTLICNEALICFICQVAAIQIIIFLESLWVFCFFGCCRAWFALLIPFLLFITNEFLVQFRINWRRIAWNFIACQITAHLTIADVQIPEHIACHRLERQCLVSILTQIADTCCQIGCLFITLL